MEVLETEGLDVQGLDRDSLLPLGEPIHRHQANASADAVEANEIDLKRRGERSVLQTKSAVLTDLLQQFSLERKPGTDRPNDVILVGSLIDSPFNLGGLSRIGEIFGIKSLQVKRRDVKDSTQFQSTAVSSHDWLPIEQVRPDEVESFLMARRLEGYSIVGIEQTDSSRRLGDDACKLPEKMVLVLGAESTGMPAHLLGEMDFCVEIAQVGMTRSANVQTAAAIVLYDFWRQRSAQGP